MTITPTTGKTREPDPGTRPQRSLPDSRPHVHAVIPPAQEQRWWSKLLRSSRSWLVLLAGILVWEAVVRVFDVPKYILPAPSAMVAAFAADPSLYLSGLWATAKISLMGFAFAVVIGVVIAILMARSALFEELVYPFLNIIRVMPLVAIAPLLLIWFGRNEIPLVICSILIAVFPIIVDVTHGLTSVDRDLINMMKLANASEFSILMRIRIPNSLPYLFQSFRVAAPGAVIGAMLGEFMGAREGLGYLITVYSAQLNVAAVFILALLSGVLGIVFFNVCIWAERLAVPWKTTVR